MQETKKHELQIVPTRGRTCSVCVAASRAQVADDRWQGSRAGYIVYIILMIFIYFVHYIYVMKGGRRSLAGKPGWTSLSGENGHSWVK